MHFVTRGFIRSRFYFKLSASLACQLSQASPKKQILYLYPKLSRLGTRYDSRLGFSNVALLPIHRRHCGRTLNIRTISIRTNTHHMVSRFDESPNKTEDLAPPMGMAVTKVLDAPKKIVLFWHEALEGKKVKLTYGYGN